MSEGDKPAIIITSHNQSGGITAHTVHLGQPRFELTDDHIRSLVEATPTERPVEVLSVGPQQRAQEMGERIANALHLAGRQISRIRYVGVWSPPPEAPLTINTHHQGFTRVIVAPNA